jgi:hypothetical protein
VARANEPYCPNRRASLTFSDASADRLIGASLLANIPGALRSIEAPGTAYDHAGGKTRSRIRALAGRARGQP